VRTLVAELAVDAPADEAEQLVYAACVLLGVADQDSQAALSAADVVRGLLRWQQMAGLAPRDAARLAIRAPELMHAPHEHIMRTMMLLRTLFPSADLSRIVENLPMHALLADEQTLAAHAGGVLTELRLLFPEPIIQLLASEEPAIFFGALSLSRLAGVPEATLLKDMRGERWIQWFRNVFVQHY
jgi:hypothetical protein